MRSRLLHMKHGTMVLWQPCLMWYMSFLPLYLLLCAFSCIRVVACFFFLCRHSFFAFQIVRPDERAYHAEEIVNCCVLMLDCWYAPICWVDMFMNMSLCEMPKRALLNPIVVLLLMQVPDAFVYLRADPVVCYDRLKARCSHKLILWN
jgi:hypothetical protein